jgi:hypothetical protein
MYKGDSPLTRELKEKANEFYPVQNGRFLVCETLEQPGTEIVFIHGKRQVPGCLFGWNTLEKLELRLDRKSMQVTMTAPWYDE